MVQLIDTEVYTNYQEELKYLVTNEKRIDYIGKLCNKIKSGGNTLVLVDRLTAGKKLAELIDDSVFIQGETKLADRKEQ